MYRVIDPVPLHQQILQRRLAIGREPIKALLPLLLLAPLAGQQALRLKPPQQRIERTLLDRQALIRQRLAQGVPVVLHPELSQHREHQAASPQLHAK